VIDLHCHLLPGLDDGPATTEDALALAQELVAVGVRTVVATPHVSPDHPNRSAAIAAGRDRFAQELAAHQLPLELRSGAELDLVHALSLPGEEVARLALGDSGRLLVECPFTAVASGFEAALARLRAGGHGIVLAHPERSPLFLRDPDLLARLVAGGALVSVTEGSLVGRFGGTAQRYAQSMLERGLVHDASTDAHDAVNRRPVRRATLVRAGLDWAVDWLLEEGPAAILSGGPVPVPPPPPRQSRWARLRARRSAGR
jgi:protein-tyrosine phosphatase